MKIYLKVTKTQKLIRALVTFVALVICIPFLPTFLIGILFRLIQGSIRSGYEMTGYFLHISYVFYRDTRFPTLKKEPVDLGEL
jgi:hypothetical protein